MHPATSDVMIFLPWLAVMFALALACSRMSRLLHPSGSYYLLLASVVVLAWSVFVLWATLLSLVAWLHPVPMFVGIGLLSFLVQTFCRSCAFANANEAAKPDSSDIYWFYLWCIAGSFVVGHVILTGLLTFPTDWDSLNYHIPMLVQWLHAHSLYAPNCSHWSFPGNNEVLGLWLVAPFSGDFFIALNNLPAALLLPCATVELGRTLGLANALAHGIALTVVANYVVINQLVSQENDAAAAALFVTALLFGYRVCQYGAVPDLILYSASLGLLAGIKYYALGYAGLAGLAFPLLAIGARGWRAGVRAALAGAIGLLVLAGYWYLRNWVVTGSPLFPLGFTAGTDVLSRGYPAAGRTSFLGNGRPEVWPLGLIAIWMMTGPCHLAAVVLLPLTGTWLIGSAGGLLRQQRRDTAAWQRITLAGLLAGSGFLWLNTPFAVEDQPGTLNQLHDHYCPVRYGMCFLSLAVVALGLLLQALANLKTGVLGTKSLCLLLIVGVLIQVLYLKPGIPIRWLDTLLVALILVLLTSMVILLNVSRRRGIALIGLTLSLIIVGAGAGCFFLSRQWHSDFAGFYQARGLGGAPVIAGQVNPPGPVSFVGFRSYPFFGSARQYRVCQPDHVLSVRELAEYLAARRVVAVVTAPGIDTRYFADVPQLPKLWPDRFTHVVESENFYLLFVRNHAGDGPTD